jgi:hypothetical protein
MVLLCSDSFLAIEFDAVKAMPQAIQRRRAEHFIGWKGTAPPAKSRLLVKIVAARSYRSAIKSWKPLVFRWPKRFEPKVVHTMSSGMFAR